MRRFVAELSAIVACAALCATVSNFLAGHERKLAPVGRYPNALTLPMSGTALEPAAAPPEASSQTPDVLAAASSAPRGPSPLLPVPSKGGTQASPPAPSGPPPAAATGVSRATAAPTASAAPVAPGTGAPAAPASGIAEPLFARFPPHPDRPFVEISGSDALWAHGRGVAFLDARRTKVYEEGHVAGARSFSVWEADVDQKVFAFQDEAAKELPVVLYCSGGECEDSHMLADKLFGAGFGNLLVYRDGWPDWVKRGGPARTGPTP